MPFQRSLRTTSTPLQFTLCITTSAGFIRRCALLLRWKRGLPITFGRWTKLLPSSLKTKSEVMILPDSREFLCQIVKENVKMDFTYVDTEPHPLEFDQMMDCSHCADCGVKVTRQLLGGSSSQWHWEKCPVILMSLVQDGDVRFRQDSRA
jgi:hypothetical protein